MNRRQLLEALLAVPVVAAVGRVYFLPPPSGWAVSGLFIPGLWNEEILRAFKRSTYFEHPYLSAVMRR